MARTVIDPVTRIGGHLRIEADVAGGSVTDAWSSGTMFRGIERVLEGRDPRDAWLFADRICGTCSGVHALASVRAVEDALGIVIPTNARLIRNLLAATTAVRDHVVQFYIAQAPDWVDTRRALVADPVATSKLARSTSAWPLSSPEYFTAVRGRLATAFDTASPGLYGNGYWDHPAYRLSPEASLMILAHGIEALDWQRSFMKIQVLFGGKDPHPQTYLVGGMADAPPWGGPTRGREHPQLPDRKSPAALSATGLAMVGGLLTAAQTFVEQVFLPDVLELARAYPDWAAIGAGIGSYLSYGEYPDHVTTKPVLFLARGRIAARDLAQVLPVDQAAVAESIARSWYSDGNGAHVLQKPASGETEPAYSGPALPLTTLEGSPHYSWAKAPRYDGEAQEVGPLARMLVAYVDGQSEVRSGIDTMMSTLGLGPEALFSTLGRILARVVEAQVVVKRADGWLWELKANLARGDLEVADIGSWDPTSWPAAAAGFSLGEGPRGAVGHWVSIHDRVVDRYQVVDASTWNASPRDGVGTRGAVEAALVGTAVADASQPLEILRTVHSFNPCAACAVHATGHLRGGPVEVHANRLETTR